MFCGLEREWVGCCHLNLDQKQQSVKCWVCDRLGLENKIKGVQCRCLDRQP